MQLPGSPSWTIQVNPWPESFDLALWFRAAERIKVAAGGEVTGPPEVEPRPDPSTDPADGAGLAVGWLGWWHALTAMPPLSPPFGRADGRRSWRSARRASPAWPAGRSCTGWSPPAGHRPMPGT